MSDALLPPYSVKYWVDEKERKAFCLVEAPDAGDSGPSRSNTAWSPTASLRVVEGA